MSDADYEAFLNKANQSTGGDDATTQSKKSYGTKSVNTAVPKALESVQEYYTSDADEPFEPVALEFEGDEVEAGELLNILCAHGEGARCVENRYLQGRSKARSLVKAPLPELC
jgi:hypothetical protein